MGARQYDPTTGRFWSVDPIDGGSRNNYDYVGQDPVNGYDLDGRRISRDDDTGPAPRRICALDHSWGNSTDCFLTATNILTPDVYNPKNDYSNNPWVADSAYEKRFNLPSYHHDVCYGSQISARSTCDKQFHKELVKSCNGAGPFGLLAWDCRVDAWVWYRGVSAFGASHFNPRIKR